MFDAWISSRHSYRRRPAAGRAKDEAGEFANAPFLFVLSRFATWVSAVASASSLDPNASDVFGNGMMKFFAPLMYGAFRSSGMFAFASRAAIKLIARFDARNESNVSFEKCCQIWTFDTEWSACNFRTSRARIWDLSQFCALTVFRGQQAENLVWFVEDQCFLSDRPSSFDVARTVSKCPSSWHKALAWLSWHCHHSRRVPPRPRNWSRLRENTSTCGMHRPQGRVSIQRSKLKHKQQLMLLYIVLMARFESAPNW